MPARKTKKPASAPAESGAGATNEPSAPPAVPRAEDAAATDARAPVSEESGSRSAGGAQPGGDAPVLSAAGGSGDGIAAPADAHPSGGDDMDVDGPVIS